MNYLKTFYMDFHRKIITQTSQTPTKSFVQHFEEKSIIFIDISLPRLRKNMSIAMQSIILKKTVNYA